MTIPPGNDSDPQAPNSTKDPQVNFGTLVPQSFHEEFKDLANASRVNMRELLFGLLAFWKRHAGDHPEFQIKAFKQRSRRKNVAVPSTMPASSVEEPAEEPTPPSLPTWRR